MQKLCKLCGTRKPLSGFDGRAKDCRDCRTIEDLRPPRGKAPIEVSLGGAKARRKLLKEANLLFATTGKKWVVDHVVPIRSKKMQPDSVLICGLDVPENLALVLKDANRRKWMHWSQDDAQREEARMMEIVGKL